MTGSMERPTAAAAQRALAPTSTLASRILVVDDEPANIAVLTRILTRNGFEQVSGTTSPREAIERVARECPDLLLLDQHMPEIDGIQLLRQIKPLMPAGSYIPVVFLSGDSSPVLRRTALQAGATDFIGKPFDPMEVVLRIGNLLETRRLHVLQADSNRELERRVRDRTAQLEESQRELFERLCRVSAYRDDDTGLHTRRVRISATRIARAMGLDPRDAELIGAAAELHDLGKVGVPDEILHKLGRLTDDETAVMRRHPAIGANALAGSTAPLLQVAEQIARWHHERWDGTGYPDGLAGAAIPLAARIVAVADVADALSHDRSYREAWSMERVRAELLAQSGRHFDPEVVAAFLDTGGAGLSPDDDTGARS